MIRIHNEFTSFEDVCCFERAIKLAVQYETNYAVVI